MSYKGRMRFGNKTRNERYRLVLNDGVDLYLPTSTTVTETANFSTGNDFVINSPASVEDGSLMVMFVAKQFQSVHDVPTGWTELTDLAISTSTGDARTSRIFWRIASSDSSTTYTISVVDAGAADAVAHIVDMGFAHADKWDVTPTIDHKAEGFNDATPPSLGITTETDGATVLQFCYITHASSGVGTWVAPDGFTILESTVATHRNSCSSYLATTDAGEIPADNYGNTGGGTTGDWCNHILAIKPA